MPRRFLAGLAAAAAIGLLAGASQAQDRWPARPVTIIVPFAAGGNTDVMARIFSDHLSKRLGQQFVVENRVGAGGVTGLNAASKAAPDGYTVAIGTSGGLAQSGGGQGEDTLRCREGLHLSLRHGRAAE